MSPSRIETKMETFALCLSHVGSMNHFVQHLIKRNKGGRKAKASKQKDPVPGEYEFPRHFHPALSLGYYVKVLRHISGKAVCLPSHSDES